MELSPSSSAEPVNGKKRTDAAKGLIPPLKWAGGKRWAISRLLTIFPVKYRCYFEPFVGGGAAFFAISPPRAVISDTNQELIRTYQAIKRDGDSVWDALRVHAKRHSDRYYYKVRARVPTNDIALAARFLYLNRTCWNGLYRVNKNGMFNVPKGTKDSVIFTSDDPAALATTLARARIECSDFEAIIDRADMGDLVYADPPYTVNHNVNGFLKYNEAIFTWADQERLAACVSRARKRGVFVVVSNANHQSVRQLYSSYGFHLKTAYRTSVISSDSDSRRRRSELLIVGNAG